MSKLLESAIERARRLPEERQAYAAHILDQLALDDRPFQVPAEHASAIREGLAQIERGEVADDDAIDSLLRKPWA